MRSCRNTYVKVNPPLSRRVAALLRERHARVQTCCCPRSTAHSNRRHVSTIWCVVPRCVLVTKKGLRVAKIGARLIAGTPPRAVLIRPMSVGRGNSWGIWSWTVAQVSAGLGTLRDGHAFPQHWLCRASQCLQRAGSKAQPQLHDVTITTFAAGAGARHASWDDDPASGVGTC